MCKVTRDEEFKPITIVLESEFEASVLKSLLGEITGAGEAREFTSGLWDELDRMGVPRRKFFYGNIKIKV